MFTTENSKERKRFGLYKCGFCGKEFKANTQHILSGHTKSCGCYGKHNLSNTKLYEVWGAIKNRTLNPKNKQYNDYGGRGITICEEWLDIHNFYNWAMSNGYEEDKGLSIDRIDNDGNYEPSNCRWTTRVIQARNQRMYKNNSSGYKGVSYFKNSNKYRAVITINREKIYLGLFPTPEDGAVAYNNYIISNNLEGFILNKLPDSHIHLQLPTKPHHQTLE
jgi:hypothetical protein